ncbi:hypothetical protein [Pedobacter psychroterrae]|uniref:Uncharacterized protein n=1 Tax=Pedobacter psychroterrae TaxID=2530453 RepID=A0A4R0NIN1_9SPHI|nr:hypothetical protein [Pedobacter psychroterrae]TCD00540.1 hypothetical protein EZ437_15085 [Pedobacter psychroterrae]
MILSSTASFAQKDRLFNIYIERSKVDFKKPTGYLELDSILTLYDGRNGHRTGLSVFNLLSKKDQILICIGFNGIDTSLNSKLKGFPGSGGGQYDANRNYIPHKLEYELYPTGYAKLKNNADLAITFALPVNPKYPVLGNFDKCKCVVLHKENNVDITIYYYFTRKSEKNLKKHLENTNAMFWFKD